MDASKFICIASLVFLSLNGLSQTTEKSFSFNETPLPEVVKSVVESFGLFVSYDPYIFRNSPPVTLELKSSSVQDALNQLIDDDFSFQIMNEYVIVKKKIKDIPETVITPKKEKQILYDTISIRKTEIFYDTIKIESIQKVEVYDTVQVQKEVIIYDTIDYTLPEEERKEKLLLYLGPSVWRRDESNMNGAFLGFSYRHNWKHFYLEASLSYQYYLENINFSQSENVVDLQIDTLSTFFIIENEERVPVFVIDSTFNEREVIREVDRTNSYHLLSVSVLIGKAFSLNEHISIGANLGVSMDWVFQVNEVLEPDENTNEGQAEPLDYRVPLHNFRLEVPISYKSKKHYATYFIAPFGDLGLNSDYRNSNISSERFRFGVKLGVAF